MAMVFCQKALVLLCALYTWLAHTTMAAAVANGQHLHCFGNDCSIGAAPSSHFCTNVRHCSAPYACDFSRQVCRVPRGASLGAALAVWAGISGIAVLCALLLLWGNEMDRTQ